MSRVATLILLLALSTPCFAEAPPEFLLRWGGTGTTDGKFDSIVNDLAVGPDGSVYVTDATRCQRFSNTGIWLATFANSGPGLLLSPEGIAVDNAGDVYIHGIRPSGSGDVINVYDADGNYLRTWGYRLIGMPFGLGVDASRTVYIADFDGHKVRKNDRFGAGLGAWGALGSADGLFNEPTDVSVGAAGDVFVSDASNHRIQVFTSSGVFLRKWGQFGTNPGQMRQPVSVTTDADGNVYVCEYMVSLSNGRVMKFDNLGNFLSEWGPSGPGWSYFRPVAVSTDPAGDLFVADQAGYVLKFGAAAVASTTTSWGRVKGLYR